MKTLKAILLISLLFLTACGEDETHKTPVTITISLPAMQGEEPYTLTVIVTGEGMEEMKAETSFSGENASINLDVPSGPNRVFTVEIKDKNGIALYSGATTQSLTSGTPATISIPTNRTTAPVTVEVTTSDPLPQGTYTLDVAVTGERMERITTQEKFTGENIPKIHIKLNIPHGLNRAFTVEVKDKKGEVLYRGATTQSIRPATPVTVSISTNQATDSNLVTVPVLVEVTPPGILPRDTYTLKITVAGNGMKEMKREKTFTGTTPNISLDVPSGEERTFTAELSDKNEYVLYTGTATQSIIPETSIKVSIPITRTITPVTVQVAVDFENRLEDAYPLVINVTGEGIDEIKAEDTLAGEEVQIKLDVPSGPDRTFTAEVKDKDGKILGSGTAKRNLRGEDATNVKISIFIKAEPPSFSIKEGRTLVQHENSIDAISFSPDGRILASDFDFPLESNYPIKLWDVATGREIATLKGHIKGAVFSLSFSPDGKLLASGGGDHVIRLWDVQTRQELAVFKGHRAAIYSLSFSPDGMLLASSSWLDDDTIRLWDVVARKELAVLIGDKGSKYVCFSPDGRMLASGGSWGNHTVQLWDVAAKQKIAALIGHRDDINAVSFSPDGNLLASGGVSILDGIRLWNVITHQEVSHLKGNSSRSLSFSPDGKLLASGSWDTITVWEVATRRRQQVTSGLNGIVRVSFSPNGQLIASADAAGNIKLWEIVNR